jgi:acetyl esterase/lipase
LDIYPRPAGQVAPIVVTVHGGGWIGGDNSGKRITCITQELAALGFAVFSINYRQATPAQDGVPMQTNDIGLATRWVKNNGANYGGDTSNIKLLGGSSGAQLVALAGLLINKAGQPPVLRGVIEMSGVRTSC